MRLLIDSRCLVETLPDPRYDARTPDSQLIQVIEATHENLRITLKAWQIQKEVAVTALKQCINNSPCQGAWAGTSCEPWAFDGNKDTHAAHADVWQDNISFEAMLNAAWVDL